MRNGASIAPRVVLPTPRLNQNDVSPNGERRRCLADGLGGGDTRVGQSGSPVLEWGAREAHVLPFRHQDVHHECAKGRQVHPWTTPGSRLWSSCEASTLSGTQSRGKIEVGKCTGWWERFTHILTKLNLATMQDAGLLAGNHLQKLRRAVGELPSEWIARFEKSEKELTEQLQVIYQGWLILCVLS